MNLNFLSPMYLLGLLGIGVPILIHLLTRRQQKRILFSAIHLLFQSQKRAVRKSVPNRLLLLLIRCLGIALLSLALAHPIFSFGGPADLLSSVSSANVFILDDSYSMGGQSGDSTLYANAVAALLPPLRKISGGDHLYSLVLASAPARVLQEWTNDPSIAEKILKASQPSYRTTSIGQAVTLALGLLESTPQEEKRIFILTDRDKNGWKEDEFPENPGPLHIPVTLIDFSGLQTTPNRAAVQNLEVRQEFLTNSRIIRVKGRVVNLSARVPVHRLNLSLFVQDKKQTEGFVDVPPGEEVEKEFSFPLLENEPIQGTMDIPRDGLLVDNRRFFSYQPDQKIKVLVVDGDPKTVAHQSESFYLERALNPFSAALSNIESTVSTLEELPRRSLLDFSVVLLCNVRDLPLGYEIQLEKYVMRGGALFIALGDQVDPKYYNEKLGNLLPVSIDALHQVGKQDEPFRLRFEKSEHPVLKIFSGKTLEEMRDIRFHSFYSVTPRENRKYIIPLWFLNKSPALVESNFGKGKVLLYVSSIDRDWNNFPIQPTFLPWTQRWVKYSARGLESIVRQDLRVGEPFVWKDDFSGSRAFIESPGGRITPLSVDKGEAAFKDTSRPGVYRLYRSPLVKGAKPSPPNGEEPSTIRLPENAEPAGAFTVNLDTRESSPEKISEEEIRDQLADMPVTFKSGKTPLEAVSAGEGFPLTTPFLLMVACMLFWEGWMVRRE